MQHTFSGSWDSTSFFSLLSRKGLNTLCRRLMINMVSSSFKSTCKRALDEFDPFFLKVISCNNSLYYIYYWFQCMSEILCALRPGLYPSGTPQNSVPTCPPGGNRTASKQMSLSECWLLWKRFQSPQFQTGSVNSSELDGIWLWQRLIEEWTWTRVKG